MSECPGILVVHEDGTRLGCTEELRGRTCRNPWSPLWHCSIRSCRDVVVRGCPECVGKAIQGAHLPRALAGVA